MYKKVLNMIPLNYSTVAYVTKIDESNLKVNTKTKLLIWEIIMKKDLSQNKSRLQEYMLVVQNKVLIIVIIHHRLTLIKGQ